MEKERSEQLKNLILKEMEYRKEFRRIENELKKLVDPINEHNRECRKWWDDNLPNAQEILVMMDNGTCLKISKPEFDPCSVRTHLPYSIDYEQCDIIKIEPDEQAS